MSNMIGIQNSTANKLLLKMKSTKVQNPRRTHCVDANARARKLATPRVVAVTRGAVSSRSNKGG